MTAQRNDTFIYTGSRYLLLGITGDSILFDPIEWELRPNRFSTAVHRGYLCEYGIEDGRIVLLRVTLRIEPADCKLLGGIVNRIREDSGLFEYERPNISITHTGSLLIGHATENALGRIGLVEACHAENLIELVCSSGHVSRVIPNPLNTERFDNYWTKHVGIATSLPLREEFHLTPLSQ